MNYYHLTIDTTRWQTLHRFSGSVEYVSDRDEFPAEAVRFEWESSHYWYLGDTLGYIINRYGIKYAMMILPILLFVIFIGVNEAGSKDITFSR